MKIARADGNIEALIEANERYAQSLKTAKNQIAMQQRDEKDFAFTYKDDIAELEAVADKIDKIRIKIANLGKKTFSSNEIDGLTADLKELEATYQHLYTKLQGKLSSDQLSSIVGGAVETEKELKRIANQIKDIKEQAANAIRLKFNDGDLNVLPRLSSEMKKLSGTYPELEAGVKHVKAALDDMEAAIGTGDEIANVEKVR